MSFHLLRKVQEYNFKEYRPNALSAIAPQCNRSNWEHAVRRVCTFLFLSVGLLQGSLAAGNCTNDRFNSTCPDVHLSASATTALVPTLLTSQDFSLKDNKYGLASLRDDQQMRTMSQKMAEEKAGNAASAPRL